MLKPQEAKQRPQKIRGLDKERLQVLTEGLRQDLAVHLCITQISITLHLNIL